MGNFFDIYFLYGNTCSGKDTVGLNLEEDGFNYVSFGNLKREEIINRTKTGILLEKQIKKGEPIDCKLGSGLISKNLVFGDNLISGFPISERELASFRDFFRKSKNLSIRGIIELKIDEVVAFQRFFNRKVCSICHFTGKQSEICPKHQIALVDRIDQTEKEFAYRLNLYARRIKPFLKSKTLKEFPRFVLDVSSLSENEVSEKIRFFIWKIKKEG